MFLCSQRPFRVSAYCDFDNFHCYIGVLLSGELIASPCSPAKTIISPGPGYYNVDRGMLSAANNKVKTSSKIRFEKRAKGQGFELNSPKFSCDFILFANSVMAITICFHCNHSFWYSLFIIDLPLSLFIFNIYCHLFFFHFL